MYDFHYDFIKKNFDAELLFTDTDSLTYEIKSENIYEKFFKWKDLFNFINYSKDLKFFSETNKKVIGKQKMSLVELLQLNLLDKNVFYKKLMVKNIIQQKE